MDRQVAAASVQTVDHGGQAMTSWSLWQDASSWRVTLLNFFSLLHFFFSWLTLANVFDFFFSNSFLSVILCVLLFIDSMLFGSLAN